MKHIIIVLILLAAVAGYFVLQKDDSSSPVVSGEGDASFLSYIPADTIFFGGTIAPYDLTEFAENYPLMSYGEQPSLLEYADKDDKAVLMLLGLYEVWMETLNDNDLAKAYAKAGIDKNYLGGIYTIGLQPVARMKLADDKAFIDFVQSAETKADVKAEEKTIDSLTYRSYSFQVPNDAPKFELVIGVNNGFATIAVINNNDEQSLSYAFGLKKPENSLESNNVAGKLIEEHRYVANTVIYADIEGVLTGLSNPKANSLGKMLDAIIPSGAEREALLSSACQDEFARIGKAWPKLVMGYTKMSGNNATMHALLAINDSDISGQLQKLRGSIPKFFKEDGANMMYSFAAGLNMDELAPVVDNLASQLKQANFQCEPLRALSEEADIPPHVLAQTKILSGIKGIGIGVSNLAMDSRQMPTELDGIITLTAGNPDALISMAQQMNPMMSMVQIPSDGSAAEIAFLKSAPLPSTPKVAKYDNHIVVFAGDEASRQAKDLKSEGVEPNGVLYLSLNYKKLFGIMSTMPGMNDPALKEVMDNFIENEVTIGGSIDFNQKGIEIIGDMSWK